MTKLELPYYGYTLTGEPDGFTLTWRRGRHGLNLLWLSFIVSAIGLYALFVYLANYHGAFKGAEDGPTIITIFVMSAVLSLLVLFVANRNKRTPGVIHVRRDRLEADGASYERQHIQSLYVRAPDGSRRSGDQFVGGGFGVTGLAAAGVAASMNAMNKIFDSLGELHSKDKNNWGWSLGVTYGTRDYLIGKHLDERRANAIFDAIAQLWESGFDAAGRPLKLPYYPTDGAQHTGMLNLLADLRR